MRANRTESEDAMAGTPPFTYLGLTIKMLRTRAGLQAHELADRAKVTKSQISSYERGHQRPVLETLEKIMAALGIDLFDLASALQEAERSVAFLRQDASVDTEQQRRRIQRKRALRDVGLAVERYLEQLERELGEGAS